MPKAKDPNLKKLEEPTQTNPNLKELGSNGVNPFGIYTHEEAFFYSTVPIESIEKMMDQDGQAQALYRIITMPIRAGILKIKAAPGGEKEAEFIRTMLLSPAVEGGMLTRWKTILSAIVKAIKTGVEIHEKVHQIRNGFVMIEKLAYRPRKTYVVLQDDRGNFLGIRQRLPTGQIDIPASALLRYVVQPEENPLYGKSMFLPAYYHYEKKHKLYYISHLAYALNAIPIKIGSYPDDAVDSLKIAYRQAISNIGTNTSIIKPEGFELEIKDSRAVADVMPLVNHHDMMMSKAVLAQMIDLGTSDNAGSYALGESHLNVLLVAIEAIMNEISEVLSNDLIPELIDWNFGTGLYPTAILEPSYNDRRNVIQSVFERIGAAKQTVLSPEFILELEKAMAEQLGFEEIDYETNQDTMIQDIQKNKDAMNGVAANDLQQQQIDQQGEIATEQLKVAKKAATNKSTPPSSKKK